MNKPDMNKPDIRKKTKVSPKKTSTFGQLKFAASEAIGQLKIATMGPNDGSSFSSIRRNLRAGLIVVLVLGGGVGGWAATTQLSGALIAQGSVVVDSNVKKVQHPTGGIVGELLVHDGDHVKAGDVLVRLDETVLRANLAIVTKGLNELMARKARLEAERDGADQITFPPELLARTNDPDAMAAVAGANKSFRSCVARRGSAKRRSSSNGSDSWATRSTVSRRNKPQKRRKSF